jgi:hypothetical protein
VAIAQTGTYEEEIGGVRRRFLLRNGEIERFEIQHAPFGIFELWDQLCGKGSPQVRHVRDILALALVGGGMSDRMADEVLAAVPPSENLALRATAWRVLGVTFLPAVLDKPKKKAGSRATSVSAPDATTPPDGSATSAA